MSSLQIRDLPEDLYQSIKRAAEREHRSLSQQALMELRRAYDQPDRRAQRQALVERLRTTPSPLQSGAALPEDLIREDRDGR